MGYNTKFVGVLKFTTELTASQIVALKGMCGEDCREHPEWRTKLNRAYFDDLDRIKLKLTDDFTGLQWSGVEKTHALDKCLEVVIEQMRKRWPKFNLIGALAAQGEQLEDRWELRMGEDGWPQKLPLAIVGKVVTCPHCERKFELTKE